MLHGNARGQCLTPPHASTRPDPRTPRLCQDVNGTPTNIVMIPYADRIFIIVTQVGKVGTLVSGAELARRPPPAAAMAHRFV